MQAKTTSAAKDHDNFEDRPDMFVKKQKMMEEILSAWWDKWFSQVFASLLPYNKWKKEHPYLNIGRLW